MKKTSYLLVLLSTFFIGLGTNVSFGQCKAKQIVKDCRGSLAPYEYDSYALNEITFDPIKPNVVEVEFSGFIGQLYRLCFCTSNFPEDVKVNIYDKNIHNKSRKLVFSSENGIEKHWMFEPQKPGTYYIDYEVPKSSTGQKKTGCMVLLIGYKE